MQVFVPKEELSLDVIKQYRVVSPHYNRLILGSITVVAWSLLLSAPHKTCCCVCSPGRICACPGLLACRCGPSTVIWQSSN